LRVGLESSPDPPHPYRALHADLPDSSHGNALSRILSSMISPSLFSIPASFPLPSVNCVNSKPRPLFAFFYLWIAAFSNLVSKESMPDEQPNKEYDALPALPVGRGASIFIFFGGITGAIFLAKLLGIWIALIPILFLFWIIMRAFTGIIHPFDPLKERERQASALSEKLHPSFFEGCDNIGDIIIDFLLKNPDTDFPHLAVCRSFLNSSACSDMSNSERQGAEVQLKLVGNVLEAGLFILRYCIPDLRKTRAQK